MKKGCLLGILKKGMTSYNSPIMLIPRKQGGISRIVTDFRHLNSRLVVLQPSIPLVRDTIQIIGASGCEVISLIDLGMLIIHCPFPQNPRSIVALHLTMAQAHIFIKD